MIFARTLLIASLALASCNTTLEPSPVSLARTDTGVEVSVGDAPFTTFHTEGTPSLYPVLAPGGLPVTRGFPFEKRPGEAEDHPHHLSLWFAHGAVNGHDFWHGQETEIRTVSVEVSGRRISSVHEWIADGRVVARERRNTGFGAGNDQRWIDVDVRLDPADSSLVFGDTKEGTFALRLAPTLRVEGEVAAGELIDSEGRSGGEVWGKRARWIAARGPVGDQEVTVAILDHPDNPRHPTWWHARKYGLLAANPFGVHDFEGSPEGTGDLMTERTIRLRYRVWIASGRAGPEAIESVWNAYGMRLER